MIDSHNKIFGELKKNRHNYHPGKELEQLVQDLNALDFIYVEDAHRSVCMSYEEMKRDDERFREQNPEIAEKYPQFPHSCMVPMTESMCEFCCSYIYFIIRKDQEGYEFLEHLNGLISSNEFSFTIPRRHFKESDGLDEKYAFVVELISPTAKPLFSHFEIFEYSVAQKSMAYEEIFYNKLRELTEKYQV